MKFTGLVILLAALLTGCANDPRFTNDTVYLGGRRTGGVDAGWSW